MRILMLEDLDTYADALRTRLEGKSFELGPVGIQRISTELEFRRKLPELVKESFQVAIFDVMTSWCTIEDLETDEGKQPPKEVVAERDEVKKWRSGVRCQRLFEQALEKAKRPPVPCIFYSVLDKEDLRDELDGDTPLVVKEADLEALIEVIKQRTGRI
jgi:hypothetical protein